ncbi:hypothetical protein [Candidatus Nitrosacidococcus tergens]|uniref:EpsG family protein n=1 Tax=Candidatus Nitrosacidococcus tergens TaxID=553981 RepID=A0A7G1Q968_9GAMM|nr:hypothetical protein [Candidatus Nitrosacidococcus tergens]CAB1275725.1 membrane protein of unknown function [Candidatus Nitrosacidococcus tergens]
MLFRETGDIRKILWLGVFIFLALLAHLLHSHGHTGLAYINNWNYTQFLFDYQDEFLKRGLLGEIVRQLGFQMSYEVANILAYGIFLGVCIALSVMFILPFKRDWQATGFLLFSLFVFSHSGTIQHFYHDFGRTDGISLVISLFSIFIIYKSSNLFAYFFTYLLMTIGILIHEATFFIYIPLVLAFGFYWDSSKEAKIVLYLLAGALLFTTYIISTYGLAQHSTLTEHYEKLVNIYGDQVQQDSVAVVHGREIKENFDFTVAQLKTEKTKIKHLKRFFVLLPTLLLIVSLVFKDICKNRVSKKLLLFSSALSPLALYPLGADFFRWWALALTNLFITLALISGLDSQFRKLLISFFYRHQILVLVAILFSLLQGDIGVS